MKKNILVFGIMFCLSVTSFSQITFSVSKGNSLTAATLGYKFKKIVPFIGFQYYGVSASVSSSNEQYDYNLNTDSFELVTNFYDDELKASVMLPSLGVKYFVLERDKLKAFTALSFTFPILSAKSDDDDLNKEINEQIDRINIWGSELSFGVEYFIDHQFSIGGEFGLRYIRFNYLDESDQTIFHPMTGAPLSVKSSESIKLNIKPTFSKMSLNFYF